MQNKVFECKRCGECCKGLGGIYLGIDELFKISSGLRIGIHSFLKNYCEISSGKIRVKPNKDGYCIFYNQHKKCTIHLFKPAICARWPFFPANIEDKHSFEIAKSACPGIKRSITHAEFVEAAKRINEFQ